jgi:CheY-like chemotaxis protein
MLGKLEKILIIEDRKEVLEVQEEIFRQQGFEVIIADDGMTGLAKAKEYKPSLILTDLRFPDISGIEICQYIKQDPELRNIPVIVSSASDMEEEEVYQAGADLFLLKPVSSQKLLTHVQNLLQKTKSD